MNVNLRGAGAGQRLTQFVFGAGSGNGNLDFFENFDFRGFTYRRHDVGRNRGSEFRRRRIVNRFKTKPNFGMTSTGY